MMKISAISDRCVYSICLFLQLAIIFYKKMFEKNSNVRCKWQELLLQITITQLQNNASKSVLKIAWGNQTIFWQQLPVLKLPSGYPGDGRQPSLNTCWALSAKKNWILAVLQKQTAAKLLITYSPRKNVDFRFYWGLKCKSQDMEFLDKCEISVPINFRHFISNHWWAQRNPLFIQSPSSAERSCYQWW